MKIKQYLWFTAGIFLMGIAYAGVILPGIPWSTPTVLAAVCFAKSSPKFSNWLYSHPRFGPFLVNWESMRVFPTKGKYAMVITMLISLVIFWFTTQNPTAILYLGIFMALVVVWAWRYPGSPDEYEKRVREGKRIAWLR